MSTTPPPEGAEQRNWWQRRGKASKAGIVAGALVLALVVGVAAGDDAGQVAESRQLVEQRDAEAALLRAQIARARRDAATAKKEAEEEARKQFAKREAELDAREKKLDERSRAINAREKEVSAMERDYEDNTIPGSGRYQVGTDIQPGTYTAEASPDCYWARLRDDEGSIDSIIDNGMVSGPVTITVAPSDHMLEVSGCADFHKAG